MEIIEDCDQDTLLIKARPEGPVCHTGNLTCFEKDQPSGISFIAALQQLIENRNKERPEGSYTTSLFEKGVNKMAQKVGEEAVELVIEAMDSNDDLFLNEAADLIYHLLVLLSARGYGIGDVASILEQRHK
jgi:phosphoribosyl-ATP pyrophosphohydrolase/phosphoribosyl-AMP cyclohydrolase